MDDLIGGIQRLIEHRAKLAQALVQIDATLSEVGVLLNASKSATDLNLVPSDGATEFPSRKKRRGRGNYEVTAEELVLEFVRERKNPTTKEINAYWRTTGRGHTADNTLVKLVKKGHLRRAEIEGERGSKYMVA